MSLRPQLKYLPTAIATAVLLAGASRVAAITDYDYFGEPLPTLTLPHLKYLDMDVEMERSTSTGGGAQTTYQRIYVAPTVGIGWDYFLYHPDLLTFSILAEPGYVWQESGSAQNMSHENDFLINGHFSATLLQLKPYATTFFADATHETRQYDFFNSLVEDVQSYGLNTGYREGAIPFTISFEQTANSSSGFAYNSTSDQTSLNLHASNERKNGNNTDLTYQYEAGTWNQSALLGGANTSTTHDLTLSDAEHFGKNTLTSTLLYNGSDYNGSGSDNVNLTENFNTEFTPHLRTFCDYSVANYSADDGNSTQNTARVGLQHQLYDSLTSTFDIHGSTINSSYTDSSQDIYSGGVTGSLDYSKSLGRWGHLSLGTTASLDLTKQSSSGSALPVVENHTITNSLPVLLKQPQAINDGMFKVIDKTTGYTLTETTDFTVNRVSNPWQISIPVAKPPNFSYGDNFEVDYDVQPNPSGTYSTFNDMSQVRLDLFGGLLDFYARYSYTENNASSPAFVLENVRQFLAGSDLNWKRVNLGASYTDDQSSLFSYHSYTTRESYILYAALHSSVTISLNQEWSFYPANGGAGSQASEVTFYNYLVHYDWNPAYRLTWSTEVGLQQQRGAGQNEDLFAARTYLSWTIGKLDLHLGYEYEDQEYVGTGQNRNYAYFRLRRNF